MAWTGTYSRSLDDKLRLAIPKPLRDDLKAAQQEVLYAAPGTDGSLALYGEDAFTRLAARLTGASPTAKDVRDFGRMFYARAQRLDIDGQGRIRLPTDLATGAGLSREVVLLGVNDHLELWDRTRWESYLAEKSPLYDQIAEAAFKPAGNLHSNPITPPGED
ncbi:MAG: division/cell wall cluster transcriptional repressor MraZ [Pirellulales bacterium]|nr:division/cell wall cluster transcriptional repressor MraZ [Pirellulales bacterium]